MSNTSTQRVMVYCDFTEAMNHVIVHGLRISQIFKKELCLFHPYSSQQHDAKLAAQRTLAVLIRKLKEDFPQQVISSLTLKGNLYDCMERLTEEYDAILLVLPSDKLKPKIRALQISQIPFLFTASSQAESLRYDRVMLPVDYRKVMKETSLWASYFGRFNQSAIEVLSSRESDSENKVMVRKNQQFIQHLLAKVQVDVDFATAATGSFGLPFEALKRCRDDAFNLLIIPASQHISLLDLLVGLPESKLIKQAGHIPVLCINPKRDMYILCD